MKIYLIILLSGFTHLIQAQTEVFLHLQPKCGNQEVQLQTNLYTLDGTLFNLEHFNYYVSDIVLFHDGGNPTAITPSVFLLTPIQQGFYLGNYPIQHLDSIQFMVGVPARLNTQQGSEAQDISSYPLNHPLSFQSPSMYWGWQFGYMHMVVGGNADSNNDQQVDAYFELHNLGNHNQRVVNLPIVATQTSLNQQDIYLECHLDQWLRNMPLGTVGVLHGETGLNDSVMANINQYPVFTQPQTAQASTLKDPKFYFFNQTVFIQNTGAEWLIAYDIAGRKMLEVSLSHEPIQETLSLENGIYSFVLLDAQYGILGSKKCLITP